MFPAAALKWDRLQEATRRSFSQASVDVLEEERARLEASYGAFFRAAWHVLEPGPLLDEFYIDAMTEHLEAVRRFEIMNLMIHIRPRMLKTTCCSIMFDAWWWGSDPTRRFLSSSFSDDRRKDDARKTRALIESGWYQKRWGHRVQLTDDQNEKHRYSLTAGGQRYTSIYGSGATGDGGHLLRLDDPQCAADQHSALELERDHEWFYNTWERRADDPEKTPHVITMQSLGPFDLCNRLRVDDPNRWQVLSLETRKASVLVRNYFRKHEDGQIDIIPLLRTDTALSRDGRYKDPRQPGELLSKRVIIERLEALERIRPSEAAAQEDQAPILMTSEGAMIHAFKRDQHVKSFAARMGCRDLRAAIQVALSPITHDRRGGWRVTTGWDHGTSAKREICVIILWSDRLKEMWVVGVYANQQRTTPREDAVGVRKILNELGIPTTAVVDSRGDIGNLGKGSASESTATSINRDLSTVRETSSVPGVPGPPILGFMIHTADKGAGSVETGVELLNTGYGSSVVGGGGVFIASEGPGVQVLVTAQENWTGGEAYKDPCDAFRYKARDILQGWLYARPGASGSAGG